MHINIYLAIGSSCRNCRNFVAILMLGPKPTHTHTHSPFPSSSLSHSLSQSFPLPARSARRHPPSLDQAAAMLPTRHLHCFADIVIRVRAQWQLLCVCVCVCGGERHALVVAHSHARLCASALSLGRAPSLSLALAQSHARPSVSALTNAVFFRTGRAQQGVAARGAAADATTTFDARHISLCHIRCVGSVC